MFEDPTLHLDDENLFMVPLGVNVELLRHNFDSEFRFHVE